MDIRFLIVGAPFIMAFFYTLFWLKRWGAFNSSEDNLSKKMTLINVEIIVEIFLLAGVFLWVKKINSKQTRQPSLSKKTMKNIKF